MIIDELIASLIFVFSLLALVAITIHWILDIRNRKGN